MPGKACDKYSGKEKQDCLNYKGRFAKMKGTQKPGTSVQEESDLMGLAEAKNARMFKRLKAQAGPRRPDPKEVMRDFAKPKPKKKKKKYRGGNPGRRY